MAYCPKCGTMTNGAYCPACGSPVASAPSPNPPYGQAYGAPVGQPVGQPVVFNNYVQMNLASPKNRTAAALLCFFLGCLGVHRFYVGKVGTGVLWLLTLGLFGIGVLVDFIMILVGSFKDGNGLPITRW